MGGLYACVMYVLPIVVLANIFVIFYLFWSVNIKMNGYHIIEKSDKTEHQLLTALKSNAITTTLTTDNSKILDMNGTKETVPTELPTSHEDYPFDVIEEDSIQKIYHMDIPEAIWDVLVFSMAWMTGVCSKLHQEKIFSCYKPNSEGWVINGLWPKKTGNDIWNANSGPTYCNVSIYQPDLIDFVAHDLRNEWINPHEDDLSNLFELEYGKYGTCFLDFRGLNGILEYFDQALTWKKKYNLSVILEDVYKNSNRDMHSLDLIYSTIHKGTGKKPVVRCEYDNKTRLSYLTEVNLCFNKSLEIIDCDVFKGKGFGKDLKDIITNCNLNIPVIYGARPIPSAICSFSTITTPQAKLVVFIILLFHMPIFN